MEKKGKIIILIIMIILFLISIFFLNKSLTGYPVKEQERIQQNNKEYSYTKAICNESNFCQDYKITCKSNETISITPLTGAVIQFDEDWQDPRTEKDKERLC